MTLYAVVNTETSEISTYTSFAVAVEKARGIGLWASILECTVTCGGTATHREFNAEGHEISSAISEMRTPLKPFTSSHEYLRVAQLENDDRLFPVTAAIRRVFDPIRKVVTGDPALLIEMRRLGLVSDTGHLTAIGVSLWNHMHS